MPNDEHDTDALDASWDEPKAKTPTPTPDVASVDEGWDSVKVKERHKTGAERAVSRKAKAIARAERQRAKAAAAAQKQKQKQPKAKRDDLDLDLDVDEVDEDEPRPKPRPRKHAPLLRTVETEQIAARRSWIRMLVAVGLIIAIAAFVLFVIAR